MPFASLAARAARALRRSATARTCTALRTVRTGRRLSDATGGAGRPPGHGQEATLGADVAFLWVRGVALEPSPQTVGVEVVATRQLLVKVLDVLSTYRAGGSGRLDLDNVAD